MNDLLEEVGLDPNSLLPPENVDLSAPGHDAATWCQMLQQALDCKELSFAEVNRKRKRLTFASFRDSTMSQKTIAVELLVEPNVHRMHILFTRSKAIASLQHLPVALEEDRAHLENEFLGTQQHCQ